MNVDSVTGNDLSLKVNDITVSYDDHGTGSIPLIFIHGFPFNKSMWAPQMEELSKSMRTIAYDIRGFGGTDEGKLEFAIEVFADDLIAFMDALQIEKAIVCGLSMGGYILLNAVSKHHDRFAGMILCDTQCIADSEESRAGRTKSIALINDGGKITFVEGFLAKLFTTTSLESNLPFVNDIKEMMLATSDSTLMATLQALANRNEMCSILKSISVPSLILCGEDDIITPMVQSNIMKDQLINATLQMVTNAAHMTNLEQADEFNRSISRFVADRLR